ncbi:hypothetical protein VSDG_08052 [Cytospora chrysosperma]|uniref:Uncharacterized protein n=1 Tax=Cytospora chrysosperma TaxID=252740 RepID=A0A423VF94_CYTCH|nr:hypothetical protein VSDG_08052 [Valsa sordida]
MGPYKSLRISSAASITIAVEFFGANDSIHTIMADAIADTKQEEEVKETRPVDEEGNEEVGYCKMW